MLQAASRHAAAGAAPQPAHLGGERRPAREQEGAEQLGEGPAEGPGIKRLEEQLAAAERVLAHARDLVVHGQAQALLEAVACAPRACPHSGLPWWVHDDAQVHVYLVCLLPCCQAQQDCTMCEQKC